MSKPAVLTEYRCSSAKLKQPIVIAQISDVHARRCDDILAMLEKLRPDLIAVTGDVLERYAEGRMPDYKMRFNSFRRLFVRLAFFLNYAFVNLFCRRNLPDSAHAYDLLGGAAKIAPVVMSLGNHEQELTAEDYAFLRKNRITLLDNADCTLVVKGNVLRVGGLSTAADVEWLALFAAKDGYKLLLSHHPEYFDTVIADKAIDLTLAGHNHGGQIRLFGRGWFSAGGGFKPKYDKGFFGGRLIVSAGCSNTVAMPRLHNPRELVAVHVSCAKQIDTQRG